MFNTKIIMVNPRIKPITGDNTIKMAVFVIPLQTRTLIPPSVTPAPMRPPMRAWEELLGRPKYQVMIFQVMAPVRADKIRRLSTIAGLMIPVPTVLATWTPTKKTAVNSKNAAQRTAFLGERTLVDTMVEMALAESWKPLRKSNTRATRIRKTTKANESGIMIWEEAVRHVSKRYLPQC
jgi:hypothetical protein